MKARKDPTGSWGGSMVCVCRGSLRHPEAVLAPVLGSVLLVLCRHTNHRDRRKSTGSHSCDFTVSPKRQLSEADAAEMGFLGIDVLSRPVHRKGCELKL